MLIDSHCHLDMLVEQSGEDLPSILQTANQRQVERFLCVAVDTLNWPNMKALCAPHADKVYLSAGIHPCNVNGSEDFDQLAEQLADPQVIATGETGLDFFHHREAEQQALQKHAFAQQIALAKQQQKPLIIHTREAQQATIEVMQSEHAEQIGGVMHCFTEDIQMAQQSLDLGFYISISGILTFKNAEQIREVACYVPLDRLLIETDSPYLAPVPMRGKTNQPAYVAYVADYLAELRGLSRAEIDFATGQNFCRLFGVAI